MVCSNPIFGKRPWVNRPKIYFCTSFEKIREGRTILSIIIDRATEERFYSQNRIFQTGVMTAIPILIMGL